MHELIYASVIVFIASALQSITGSGFAIMAGPFLLILYNSQESIQVSILLSFLIAVVLTPKIKQHIDYRILKQLIVGSIFGVPIGVAFFAYAPLETLKITIAIVVLSLTMLSLYKYYQEFIVKGTNQLAIATDASDVGMIDKSPANRPNDRTFLDVVQKCQEILVGFFAGALTTSVNMPGVPTSLYFNHGNFKNEVVRSTTLGFFIVVYMTGMAMQFVTVGVSPQVFTLSGYLMPSVILGIIVGNLLFKKINRSMFQLMTNAMLLLMGIYILVKSL
ncbi:sulfite exporter TauE/SafE family protein [Desulfotomaculum sp. 1211_IL3151]|uniref:sulfite exporter TauE/SafE family protein n=1 Tax=Desulfotomaculum sp. 1211_IL3151 TaxID=3084055 RepID=UPI002FD93C05